MLAWRCPHCGAPQPETARCWVCQRSTTCCATCRHFRRAVAPGLGYCGLDRRRVPLIGDEIRACWSGSIGPPIAETAPFVTVAPDREARPPLAFVPVETLAPAAIVAAALADEPKVGAEPASRSPATLGWTLWGDAYL